MMALSPEEVKKRLEQISALPPKERITALQKFEEEQKKIREEEEKKLKQRDQEAKDLLKNSIEEVARQDEEQEKILKQQQKEADALIKKTIESVASEEASKKEKENKKDSLEDIAKEAPDRKIENERQQFLSAYQNALSQKPAFELYSDAKSLQEQMKEKGYLNPQEQYQAENIGKAMYQKEQTGYAPDQAAKRVMSATEQLLHDMQNPIKNQKYMN